MHIEFTLNWVWWQYLLAIIGVIYTAGSIFFLSKGAGFKLSFIWPLFFLFGGINVQ
jgi:hypothetical protein